MKVSVITATKNNVGTIEQCINSVSSQSYDDLEYIIIDGASTDGTLEIIEKHQHSNIKKVSEPDNGIYHALNKGLKMAGGDIIGILHADDFYAHEGVIDLVVAQMKRHNLDSCYGDLLYVSRNDPAKIIRYWESRPYKKGLFQKGWMPPHPTFFVKKRVYEDYGCFNTDFKIAADYELMLRFLDRNEITTHYVPEVLIKMRTGGDSNRNLKNILIKSFEDYKAWKMNNPKGGLYTIFLKNLRKLPQFFKR